MKKKMIKIICTFCALTVIGSIAGYVVYDRNHTVYIKFEDTPTKGEDILEKSPANELIGKAQSEDEAKEIANLYNIVLKEFSDGMALYETEESPLDVIERGEKEGYPQLWMNNIRLAD